MRLWCRGDYHPRQLSTASHARATFSLTDATFTLVPVHRISLHQALAQQASRDLSHLLHSQHPWLGSYPRTAVLEPRGPARIPLVSTHDLPSDLRAAY